VTKILTLKNFVSLDGSCCVTGWLVRDGSYLDKNKSAYFVIQVEMLQVFSHKKKSSERKTLVLC
jgi:hypothetical protein